MANGEYCKKCGHQETAHDLGEEGACWHFVSEVDHADTCPVIGCNGDCAGFIARLSWEAKCAEHRMENSLFLVGGRIVRVDIGS